MKSVEIGKIYCGCSCRGECWIMTQQEVEKMDPSDWQLSVKWVAKTLEKVLEDPEYRSHILDYKVRDLIVEKKNLEKTNG